MTAADCLELRVKLAEHAVSTLPEPDRAEVERHLEWCAGCRKEARELQEGAAMVGLSLQPLDPPVRLEDRVVANVQRTASLGRPSRKRVYLSRTVTVLAAVIGIVGILVAGTLLAQRQTAREQRNIARVQAENYRHRFTRLLRSFERTSVPSHLVQVVLRPTGSTASGGAIRETSTSSSRFPPEIAVIVAGLERSGAPYRVWLVGTHGRQFMIPGYMPIDDVGGGQLLWSGHGAGRYRTVEVRDAKGHVALTGTFRRSA